MLLSRKRVTFSLIIVALVFGVLGFAACAPKEASPSTSGAEQSNEDQSGGVDTADSSLGQSGGGSSDSPSAPDEQKPSYDGTDPEQIITVLCSEPMCHAADVALGYKTTAKGAELRVDTHSSVEVDLTDAQIASLKEYFTE
jgi:hypothetical protein